MVKPDVKPDTGRLRASDKWTPKKRARVADVRRMKALRYGEDEIVAQISHDHDVKPSTVRHDLNLLRAEMAADLKKERSVHAQEAMLTAKALMREALANGDRKTAAVHSRELNLITGVHAPTALSVDLPEGVGVLVLPPAEPGDDDT